MLGVTDAAGHFGVTVYVPFVPALMGTSVFCQGLVVDATANDLGAVTTNALDLVVGN